MNQQQYLTFKLCGEQYGIEILKVKEIIKFDALRKIPNTPVFIKGVLNLRGEVVPIVDLRERFQFEGEAYTPKTVIVIVNIDSHMMGIIADAVLDVLDVKVSNIKEPPNLGTLISVDYIYGIYIEKEHMVMLLNIEKLLDAESFGVLSGLR